MDKQPFSSLSLAFQDGSQSRISTRSAAAKKHNSDVTKNLLSAQIEDNLSRLLECLKLEYGKQILVSPKWKNFGSQKLQFAEKTRLNNAIWRCWHIQYLKNKKPLFCQFVSPLSSEREPPKKPLTVVLQGRYWRRKLDAIAREYKKWRIYYKNKNQGLDDSFERSRSYSTSSTGDDEAAHGSPLTQVAGLMDLELTTDLVHSHPDTLFTTKTEPIPKPNVSEIVYQPTLDSLQPNLDEFTKHLESLVDGMVQSGDSIQLTNSFLARHEQQDTSLPSYQDQQEQMDMMDDSNDYNHMYSMCSTSSALNTSQTQPFIDATEPFTQFPMDYNNQMEIQTYETSPMSQPLSESLTELEEEPEQEIFPSKSIASPIQIPQSTPSSTQLPTHQQATSHTVHHGQLPYRHSTSNLQEYGTSPTRKGRLPRNVSDNQLSMIDHSQLNYNLHFGSPTERKIPAKEQFPNLVAYLQSHNGNTESTASQAKRPRIPRNMSDSRLYNTSNMNLNYLQNIASGNSQQTPLDQIQAQSQRQQTTLNTTTHLTSKQRGRKGKLPRNMSDSSLMYMNQQQLHMPVSQPSTQRRKSLETKSAMSPPSSLQSAHPVFSSTLAAAHEVNQAMRQEAAAATRVAITTTAVGPSQTFDQSSLMDQLVQLPQGASLLKTTNQQKYTLPSSSAQTGQTVLSQLLLQGETTIPQKQDSEGNYVVKQVLDLLQKQVPQSKQVSCPEVSSTWKGPSANQQQPSELMSLLQGSPQGSMVTSNTITDQPDLQKQMSLQPQQHAQQQQQISPHQQLQQLSLEPHQHLPLQQKELQQQLLQLQSQQQKLPKHSPQSVKEKGETHPVQQHLHQFIQQQQQLKQQLQQNQHSSQLISALQSTNNALQQHLFPQQKVLTVQQPQNLQQAQHQVQQSRHPQEEVKLQQKHQHQLLHQQPQQHVQQLQHQQQLQQQQLQHQHQQLQQQHQEQQQQLQQQHQHLLPQQGIVYTDNQPVVPKMTPINIQPRPQSQNLPAGQAATIMITPQPLSAQTGVQAQAQPVTLGSLPVNLLPLQQIISGNPGTQVVLPVPFKLSSTNPLSLSASTSQQTKGINSTVDSLSQTLFATHTTTAAATSTMTATVTTCGSTCSSSEFSFSSIPLTTSATRKFSRPVAAADREHYKEHRRQSHISAEQKRRFNIKVGFDQLVGMVPSLASQKNSKVSKATILQKSYEFIAKLQREREKVHEEQEMLKKESQLLFASISQCQQKLPAFGVPLNKQRADQMMALFNQYVKGRSQDNYKFWILAVMFRQMFESYNQKVSSATWEEFCTSILSWMDKQCTLPTLRPAVLSALRDISRTTSILTDPSMVPQEIQRRVAAYEDPTNLSETNRSSSSGAATNFFHSSSS